MTRIESIQVHELESLIKTILSVIENDQVKGDTKTLAKNFLHKIFEKLEETSR